MGDDDEKSFGFTPKRALTHEIGQVLDSLSVAELDERVECLKAEIHRLEEARRLKHAALAAAAAFFKS